MIKCLQMVKDISINKEYLSMSKIKLNIMF